MKLVIENVGISMDSLYTLDSEDNNILRGFATVYSTDGSEEYADDFEFSYHIKEDFICCDLPEDFLSFKEEIEEILIDNIKTNC